MTTHDPAAAVIALFGVTAFGLFNLIDGLRSGRTWCGPWLQIDRRKTPWNYRVAIFGWVYVTLGFGWGFVTCLIKFITGT
jgi:hypothetical protein